MAITNPLLSEFQGGQMTDLPLFTGTFVPTALLELVSPGTAAEGVNYAVQLQSLALYLISLQTSPTFVTSGATYNSVATDTRILVNKTIGSATSVVLLSGASYMLPALVKDLKGDADVNPITVTFPVGITMDGLSSVIINTSYGYFWFNPLATGNFYEAS